VDDEARLFRYRIDEQSMMPLENYEGSLHVTDLSNEGCEVLWLVTYTLLTEEAELTVRDGLQGLLRTAIAGIGGLVAAA